MFLLLPWKNHNQLKNDETESMNSVWKTDCIIYLLCLFAPNQVYLFSNTDVVLNNCRRNSHLEVIVYLHLFLAFF